jgi:hypothetical protein
MGIRLSTGERRSGSRWEPLIGGVICTALAVPGWFIAFGDAPIDGGLPLIPDGLNRGVGRFAFGAGALACTALAVYAFREALTWHRRSEPPDGTGPGA